MITYEDIEGFYYLGKEIEWYEEHIKKLLSCKYLSSIDEERLQRYYSGLSRSKAKRAETQAFFDNISDKYLKDIFIRLGIRRPIQSSYIYQGLYLPLWRT